MSGGSYDYLYCKGCHELFAYSNVRTLEEMESRFLELGYEDVAKDFRRLIEYIKSANNRVEVLGGQLNEMMHDIEWYDSGDIGADTLAERVEEYRQADTPQTDLAEDAPRLEVTREEFEKIAEQIKDTPLKIERLADCDSCEHKHEMGLPCYHCPIAVDCGWGKPE